MGALWLEGYLSEQRKLKEQFCKRVMCKEILGENTSTKMVSVRQNELLISEEKYSGTL